MRMNRVPWNNSYTMDNIDLHCVTHGNNTDITACAFIFCSMAFRSILECKPETLVLFNLGQAKKYRTKLMEATHSVFWAEVLEKIDYFINEAERLLKATKGRKETNND